MTRRDAGVVLWAAAGFFAVAGGVDQMRRGWEAAAWPLTYRSVTATERDSAQTAGTVRAVVGLLELIAGVVLLRRRAALARWLFPQAEAVAGLSRPDPAASEVTSAGEPEIQATPTIPRERGMAAQEICSVVIAALGIWVTLWAVRDLAGWLAGRALNPWTYLTLGILFGRLLFGAAGWLVFLSRERIAARVLARGAPPSGPSEIQSTGIRLLGLCLILWYIPWLPVLVFEFVHAGGFSSVFVTKIYSGDVVAVFSLLLGSVLFAGRKGVESSWRKLRSRSEDEMDLPEVDHFD